MRRRFGASPSPDEIRANALCVKGADHGGIQRDRRRAGCDRRLGDGQVNSAFSGPRDEFPKQSAHPLGGGPARFEDFLVIQGLAGYARREVGDE